MNAICWRRACQAKCQWFFTTALGWVTNMWDCIPQQFFPSALSAEAGVNDYFEGIGPFPFFFSAFLQIQYYAMKVQHPCFYAMGVNWVSNKKKKENATKYILWIVVGIWSYEQLLYSSQYVSVDRGLSSHQGENPTENKFLCSNSIRDGPGCNEFSTLWKPL